MSHYEDRKVELESAYTALALPDDMTTLTAEELEALMLRIEALSLHASRLSTVVGLHFSIMEEESELS